MAIAWTGGPGLTAEPPPPDRKQAAEALGRLIQVLEASDREGPRETFDPRAVARACGDDPVKLFEWVRDNTHWVPYRGALRGPAGVLMDRVGSSLDRALLLAELLHGTGHKVQLRHATLTPEQAGHIATKVRPLPDGRVAALAPEPDDQVKARLAAYAQRFGLDRERLQSSADRASLQTSKAAEEAVARVAEQVPALADALGKAALDAGPENSADPDPAAVATDHWWVGYQQGGSWVDVDPMLPDAKHGVKVVDATGEPLPYLGKLPEDPALCHEVQIEVKVGRWTPRGLEEATALRHTLRPAEVLGTRVALSHLPLNWPTDTNLLAEKDPGGKIRELASAQREWLPILHVGADPVRQSSFDDTGKINTNPALSPMQKTGSAAARAAKSVFDALDSNPQPAAKEPDGQLVAEWIDYEIRSPGRPALRVRRQLFDLTGGVVPADPAAGFPLRLSEAQTLDRALSPLGDTEILLQPCSLSSAFVDHVAAQGVLANAQAMRALVSRDTLDPQFASDQIGGLVAPPGAVYGLALARGHWSPVKADVYLDRPNVLTHHQVLRTDLQAGPSRLQLCEGFDIVCNDVAVRGAGGASHRAIRFQQGVADTAAEAALMSGCGELENASELFAAAADRGEKWVALRQRADLATLDLPKEAKAHIERDLAAGHVVIVPRKAAQADARALVAWWRVDPRSGQTLGISQSGWGGAVTTENIVTLRILMKVALMFKCIGGALGGGGNVVGGVTLCALVGIIGTAGLVGGVAGGIFSLAADIISLLK